MSEVFRTDSNDIVRREDDGEDEFFSEEEYIQAYQDAPEKKMEKQEKPERSEERMKAEGAKINKIVVREKQKETYWYKKGQYE